MFGRKRQQPEPPKPRVPWKDMDIDVIGFHYGNADEAANPALANKAYGITSSERTHMALFGMPGSGKSTIIKMLAYQNIMRNQGFMIVDPHGELARDVLSMVPQDRHEDVVYVSPASLYRWQKTVQINPLQVSSDNERYVVVMAFVNTLQNLYSDSWGPRLETVLRNAANALVESKEHNTLRNMSALITDGEARAELLENVSSKEVRHFWEEIFQKQYSKDAGSSAYNKIDKILATPTVAAMFDATQSSISISDIIENRRMLIVDLSTGASDDIAQFLGSIFLNMLYVEAKRRIDIKNDDPAEMRKNPFYVYVDESHMFSNSTMSEMLRALRKFGIKVTLATQTCNAYDKDFAGEITGVCKTVIAGRCDENTARLVRAIMSVSPEELQRLPNHTFAMHTDERGVTANAIFRSRPVPSDGMTVSVWSEVAATSVKKWGREVSIEKYIPRQGVNKLIFSPLETAIIHLMHFDQRDWYREEIYTRAKTIFPAIKERDISGTLDKLSRERYVTIRYPQTDDGDQNETRKRYVLGEKTYHTYLSKAAGGRRAGSSQHLDVIFAIADENMKKHRHCVPDLGDRGPDAPDLLIVEPAITKDRYGNNQYDPLSWNERTKLAVEVETDPTKHIDQAVKNYTKNISRNCNVWFVCFREEHRAKLEEAIREQYPKFERCKMDTINHVKLLQGLVPVPKTYDEGFSSVNVRTIPRVLEATEEEIATKRPASIPYSLETLKSYNDASNREAPKAIPGKTADLKTGEPAFQTRLTEFEEVAKPEKPPGDKHVHLSDLECAILEIVREYIQFRNNDTMILAKLKGRNPGIGANERSVHKAVRRLVMSGVVGLGHAEVQQKRGSLDGSGDRRTTKKVQMLTIPERSHKGFEEQEESEPEAIRRDTIHDDMEPRDLSNAALLGIIADENMRKHHDAVSAELRNRGLL